MSERLTASLEDGTLERLRTLAGGERKVGAYLSDVVAWLWGYREALQARPLSGMALVHSEWIMTPEEQQQVLLEIVQRSGLDARIQRRLRRRLVDTAIPAADTRILPPALRCELLEENRADYAWIAHEFLQRDDGRLFLEPEPALDEEWDAVSVPDDDPSLLPRLLHWLETA